MIPIVLAAVALIPLATIVQYLLDDAAEAKDVRRLTEPLPEPRQNLAFPLPVTPMDLPARDAIFTYQGPSRVRERAGRHRIGVAIGRETQRARWNTDTGQFWLIVADMGDLDEPCSHCAAPEDGEPAHAGCPGCCCPCSTALPEGVDGYAIPGRTR